MRDARPMTASDYDRLARRYAATTRAPRGAEPRVFVGRSALGGVFTAAQTYALGGFDVAQIGSLSTDGLFEPGKDSLAPKYEAPPRVAPPDRDQALSAAYRR